MEVLSTIPTLKSASQLVGPTTDSCKQLCGEPVRGSIDGWNK